LRGRHHVSLGYVATVSFRCDAFETLEAMHQRCICRDLRNGLWRTWFILGNGSKPTAEPCPQTRRADQTSIPGTPGCCVGPLRSRPNMTVGNIDRRQALSACWPGAWHLPQFPVDYRATWWVRAQTEVQYEPIWLASASDCAG
jgi:hypothetical protein